MKNWRPMLINRPVIVYGLVGGLLISALKWAEYRFLVLEHSFAIYGGLTAVTFAGLGLWLGVRLTARRPALTSEAVQLAVPASFQMKVKRDDLALSRRELAVLELIAQGMSNREIAGKLFVSENTVKSHARHVFEKLGAKRRTQAVQLGKEFGLLG